MSTGVPLDVIEKRLYQRIDASRLGIDSAVQSGSESVDLVPEVVQDPKEGPREKRHERPYRRQHLKMTVAGGYDTNRSPRIGYGR